jgi:uncharacterized protein YggE
MNRWILSTCVLLVGLLVGWGVTNVAAGHASAPQQPSHLVTVSGTATVSTAPDEAKVSIGVRSQGADTQSAFQANSTTMTAVMKGLAQQGVAKSDAQTTNVNLYKQTVNRGTPQETQVWVAENQVEVTIRDLTKTGDIIDAAVAAGATDVGGIQFQLSDPNAARMKALDQAVRNAQGKASAMAAAAGSTVGEVVTIREQTEQRYGQPLYAFGSAQAGMPAPTTPVSPGNVQTQVTVTAVYQLVG